MVEEGEGGGWQEGGGGTEHQTTHMVGFEWWLTVEADWPDRTVSKTAVPFPCMGCRVPGMSFLALQPSSPSILHFES